MIYQTKSKAKIVVVFFLIAFIFVGIGAGFYIYRYKEPTHGVFVHNLGVGLREEGICGHLYQSS